MPTVRKRYVRRRHVPGRLTEAQRETLLYGAPILAVRDSDGPNFASEAEAAAAWRRNRAELMAEMDGPGQRPNAFFRFELGKDLDDGLEEAEALDVAGLLDITEAQQVEKTFHILDPDQHRELCSNVTVMFNDSDRYMLRREATGYRIAADWHARRGRRELEAKYRDLQKSLERMRAE